MRNGKQNQDSRISDPMIYPDQIFYDLFHKELKIGRILFCHSKVSFR